MTGGGGGGERGGDIFSALLFSLSLSLSFLHLPFPFHLIRYTNNSLVFFVLTHLSHTHTHALSLFTSLLSILSFTRNGRGRSRYFLSILLSLLSSQLQFVVSRIPHCARLEEEEFHLIQSRSPLLSLSESIIVRRMACACICSCACRIRRYPDLGA